MIPPPPPPHTTSQPAVVLSLTCSQGPAGAATSTEHVEAVRSRAPHRSVGRTCGWCRATRAQLHPDVRLRDMSDAGKLRVDRIEHGRWPKEKGPTTVLGFAST